MKNFVLSLCLCAVLPAFAAEWENVDDDHYVAGRKCSSGYLQGKVVLVCRDASYAERMEEVWTSFKTKPFVLLGSFKKAPKGVSYPVYSNVTLTDTTIEKCPLYVFDALGRARYRGVDERRATEVVVTVLTDMESPKSIEQAKQYLEYEIKTLPGRAVVRYQDAKKSNPSLYKTYAEQMQPLLKDSEVKKLAELVRLAKLVKDADLSDSKKAAAIKPKLLSKIREATTKYAPLKESENPLVVQEAKNALADLAWAKATLK